jgi:DNA modification methylase
MGAGMSITTKDMQLVSIEKLVPYQNNARTHSKEQIAKLRSSIREFGFINPVIIDRDYGVIAGHGRIMAAREEGITEVPCVFVDHLTEAQKKAYILADNRMALDAGWDEDLLKIEMEELQGLGFDLSLTGFDEKELSNLFDTDAEGTEDGFDVDKALNEKAFVQTGDVWLLGRHRLVCGDSTKTSDVQLLMDGKKANVLITDPPYNVSIEGGTGLTIQNDSMSKEKFYGFLLSAFRNAYDSLSDGAAAYVFHSDSEKVNFYNSSVEAGFKYMSTCIWVKNALVLGRGDYQQKHEPVLYLYKSTAAHKFYGDRKQTTVWEFDRPTRSPLHPTMKPVALIAYPMKLSSQANGIVLDLFGGSGTTLIAAEQLDRIAFLMELDPKYASVIVRRYAATKGGVDDIKVVREGVGIPCGDIYQPTEEDLSYQETNVQGA